MNCILCSGVVKQYAPTSYMGLPINYCKKCDLYATGNSKSEVNEKLFEYYKESKWIGTKHYKVMLRTEYADPESQGKKRQWVSQYAYCKEFLKNHKKILEIGAGAGQTLYWFEKEGFSVTGIEPDKQSVESINKKLKHGCCMEGFIEDISLNEKFDIIWLSHVFEHLVRPDLFLEKCKNYLNHDGVLFIEVPNCENKQVLQDSIDEPSTFHFSKKSLENMSKKMKFQVVRCDYFRSAKIIEGGKNKLMKKILNRIFYPYYPKIITNKISGTDIRIILKN